MSGTKQPPDPPSPTFAFLKVQCLTLKFPPEVRPRDIGARQTIAAGIPVLERRPNRPVLCDGIKEPERLPLERGLLDGYCTDGQKRARQQRTGDNEFDCEQVSVSQLDHDYQRYEDCG